MITKKQETAAAVFGCVAGMAIAGAILAAGWVMIRFPYAFWLAVSLLWVGALCFVAMQWARDFKAWRRERRQSMYICLRCGKLNPLDKHLAHRCPKRKRRNGGVA
jgi:ribosomal protein L40E